MNRTKGATLVELMITVAIVGILSAGPAMVVRHNQATALAELQRERALLLLEYGAACVSTGRPLDDDVVARMTHALPEAAIDVTTARGLSTVKVDWREPNGRPASRSLVVFDGGGAQ